MRGKREQLLVLCRKETETGWGKSKKRKVRTAKEEDRLWECQCEINAAFCKLLAFFLKNFIIFLFLSIYFINFPLSL